MSRAILLLLRLICCITWVASNLLKYALAKLGFFCLASGPVNHWGTQSLSFRAATKTKNPNLANGGFTREERGRHEDEEWQKIPRLERALVRRRRRRRGEAAEAILGKPRVVAVPLVSLLSPLSSFHSRIPLKLIRLAPLSVPSLIPGHIRHADRDATATEDEDDDALQHFLSRFRFSTLFLAMSLVAVSWEAAGIALDEALIKHSPLTLV